MKKLLTKILGITAGIAMAIGVGAGIALNNNQKANPVYATPMSAFSFSRSDSTNSVTDGYEMVLTNYKNAATYYQDKNTTVGLDIGVKKTSGAIWSTTPVSISLTVKVGGGSTRNPLTNNVTANLIDSSGNEIANTSVTVTNKVETTTGKDYTVSVPVANNAAGVMVHHTKETDYNIRIYTISLSYETADSRLAVAYNANGGSGTMTDPSSPYESSSTVTVLSNSFTRANYAFDHWNTEPDDSGEDYGAGDTFEITSNITLYAQWEVVKYTDVDSKITWPLSVPSYESIDDSSASWDSSKASISVTKSGSTTATNNWCPPTQTSTRFYTNSEMTISPKTGYKISSIVFTAESTSYATSLQNSAWTNASAVASSSTVTVTPTIKPNDVVVKFGAAVGVTQIIVNYSSYSPLDSIAISGTYPTEFTQGDEFSHAGMVITATYENDSNANVTASATWSGYNMAATGNQTVTVSYIEEGVTRTTTYSISVSAPLTPFVVPETDSVEGFSGQSHILSFDYGNLAGALSAVSNDEGVVEVTSFSYSAGEGTVTLGFVAAGSTTIEFFDGASTLGVTVSVSVTTSTVTITGLAVRDSVQLASTLDLGSTISVMATGSCSSDLTWTSSNGDIATVDEDGVVTGVAQGTVNITVKADDYPSAILTCAVTVAHKKTIDFTTGYNVAKPASAQEDLSSVEINDYELNILNCHNNGTKYEYMMFATKELGTNNLISNKTPTPGEISKIVFKIREGSAAGATYKATLSNSEVTAKVTSSTYSRTGAGNLVITADPNDDLRYFGISCSTSNANGQLESIDIYYREPSAKEVISEIDTLSSLSYSDYTKVAEDNYTFTDLLIRYGGFISQDLWERLDDELDIQGYGVILSTGNEEIEDLYAAAKDKGDTVVEALAEFVDGTNIKRFYTALSLSKIHPAEATTAQKELMGVDTAETYYIWTLGKGISSEHMTTVYNVVAYIIVDGDIVFLNAAKESAKTLAADLIDNDVYEESDFGGSLKYLADLPVLP